MVVYAIWPRRKDMLFLFWRFRNASRQVRHRLSHTAELCSGMIVTVSSSWGWKADHANFDTP